MIIYLKHKGQLCNVLWSLWPAYAFAFKNKRKLHVLFANRNYIDRFPQVHEDSILRFHHEIEKPLPDFARKLTRLMDIFEIHTDLKDCRPRKYRVYSINGWEHHADQSNTYDHDAKIAFIRAFGFEESIKNKVTVFLNSIRGGEINTKIIGVHIRRGDYKEWKNGNYYYSDDAWVGIMKQIETQLADKGYSCKFLLCSNETLRFKYEGKSYQMTNSDGITDLCALSCCDMLVGPPSTYSQWASFINDVPLYIVVSPNESIGIDMFSPIVKINRFKNERTLTNDSNGDFVIR